MDRKEKIYAFMGSDGYVPLKEEELAVVLDVPQEDRELFSSMLADMEREGLILKSRKGRYITAQTAGGSIGVYSGSERGFGFVVLEREEDVFIPNKNTGGAMHGDRVLVRIRPATPTRRREGEIIRVLHRENRRILCLFQKLRRRCYAVADAKGIWQTIQIHKSQTLGAQHGQKVMVEITQYPVGDGDAKGRVVEILGWANDPAVSQLGVMRTYGLPEVFPDAVLQEAKGVSSEISQEEIASRRDEREKLVITIDGEDARDLDDAVSVSLLENGNFLLGVYIADVSHYVKPGSLLEEEAVARGTSVYLAGGVIPMLPPRLSNGICSLNQDQDRLVLCCEMEIDSGGLVVSHDIFQGVIRSKYRMTYTDVTKILNGDPALMEQYTEIVPMLKDMERLASILKSRRKSEGSIDFNFPELKLIYDDNGGVKEIYPYEYTISNSIIEEFMLCANRTVAEHFFWLNAPFVYRVHAQPSPEKIEALSKLLSIFHLKIKGRQDEIHPRALQQILDEIKGQPYEVIVSTVMLRSMMKAGYSTANDGHFGLGAKYYCHFTSPIRRLADLAVHRVITSYLEGKTEQKDLSRLQSFCQSAALAASEREIVAEEAERTSVKLKIAEYMTQFIGHRFDGIISSVVSFGFFVQLPNGVEGLVRLVDLEDDYYHYIENSFSLKGERTGNTFHIGDTVSVMVRSANTTTGEIDFEPMK